MELMNDYCTREWIKVNGVNGMLVTGPNGGQIFLPAAGGYSSNLLQNTGVKGGYWSSTNRPQDPYGAYYFYFYYSQTWFEYYSYGREDGQSVRAVCP